MLKKENAHFEIFDYVKGKKKSELLQHSQKKNKPVVKRKKVEEKRIVIEINDDKSQYYIKHINFRKEKIKKYRVYFITFIFLLMIGGLWFLGQKYLDFQYFLLKNEEVVKMSQKYLEQQKIKEEELKSLQGLTLENINNLPEAKKDIFMNIVPSGNPLLRELEITSSYGFRNHPISGGVKDHKGIDLRLNIGDDVVSTAMGEVVFAGEKGGYGNTVIIEHMYGFKTLFAHLDKIYVRQGEIVGKGKVIAAGGNSGNSTGPHLHYEILYNNTHVEPENFIKWDKNNFNILFNNEKNVQWEYFLTIMGKN